jgi:hypothetical protein
MVFLGWALLWLCCWSGEPFPVGQATNRGSDQQRQQLTAGDNQQQRNHKRPQASVTGVTKKNDIYWTMNGYWLADIPVFGNMP